MIKFNTNKMIINMISIYVVVLFFYGIIVKFTIWNPTLFAMKTYIPEGILIFCTFLSIITCKLKLNYKILIMFIYSLFLICINYIFNGANMQSFYWWRDLYIPLFSSMILLQREFTEEEIKVLFKKLIFIAKIFLIFGLGLAIIEQIKGDIWTSEFYTGYSFYGQDTYSKIKIAHNMGLLRAPSLTGNFSTFAYYSCFSLFLILIEKKNKKVFNIFWIIVSILCTILSTNKSAIISLIVVLIIYKSVDIRKKNKKINRFLIFLIFSLIILMLIFNNSNIFSEDSSYTGGFLQRFDVWNNIIKNINMIQVIIPYKTFMYGSGSSGEFGNSFFDNIYLYCFVTQGIIGFIIWIDYLRSLFKNLINGYEGKIKLFIKNVFYFFLIVGLTSNTIQGHGFFCLMIILFSILYKFNSK